MTTDTGAREGGPRDFDLAVESLLGQARGWRFDTTVPGTVRRRRARVADTQERAIEVQRLLDELDSDLGFVLPPRDQRRLRRSGPADTEAFTDAVFAAEGLDPGVLHNLRRQVKARVDRYLPDGSAATRRRGA